MTRALRAALSVRGADDRMIGSSGALFEHLAEAVRGLDPSDAAGCVAALGPMTIRLTLHGAVDEAFFFDAFPSVLTGVSAMESSDGAPGAPFAIDVVDGARCGVARPRLAWEAADFGFKRVVPGWSDDDRTTYFLRGEDGVAVADWQSGRAHVWLPSTAAVAAHERAAPFRWIIDGLAQRHGLTTLHAAAIGLGGIGLLIVGEGGRGKSTLALAAIDAGMTYLADDYALVDVRPPCRAYRLFNTAKLRPDSSVRPDWIADLAHEREPVDGGKLIFNLAHHAPEALADRLEIRALLLPEFTDGALPVLERVSPSEAFRRTAPSTAAQCQGSEAQAVADVGRLVRTLPSYRLHMPRDPRRSIERIRELLRALPPSPEWAA